MKFLVGGSDGGCDCGAAAATVRELYENAKELIGLGGGSA